MAEEYRGERKRKRRGSEIENAWGCVAEDAADRADLA